jgi:hypothetical protein
MRPHLIATFLLVSFVPGIAQATTLPYLGSQVEVTGVVQPGATIDRIRVADQAGDVFDVNVNRDSTFVSSHALLRAKQVVRVDGRLVSGRDGAGQTIDADEISDGSVDLTAGPGKPRNRGWAIALGAAAGVLLGSGVYVFRKTLFGTGAQPVNGATSPTVSSGVQFGGGQ